MGGLHDGAGWMDDRVLYAMVYAMPDPVACVDGAGRILCWNKGAAALFLVDESAAVGRPLGDVLHAPGDIADGRVLRATRGDGSSLEVSVAVSPAVEGSGALVVFQSGDAPADPRDSLSPRLLEVLDMLLEGQGEKQIAYDLAISQHTVHDYVKTLYRRYGVASRAELLALVLPRRAVPR